MAFYRIRNLNVPMNYKLIKQKIRKEISDLVLKHFYKIVYNLRFSHIAHPKKNILIGIDDIKGWYRGNRYSEFTFTGIIKGGDWDSKITSKKLMLETSDKYSSIQ